MLCHVNGASDVKKIVDFWFLKERGIKSTEALEDLKLLKEHLHEIKEESFYSQKRRSLINKET